MITLGNNAKSKRSSNPQGAHCQKCLEHGHWTYECKGKRKIVMRDSRMTILNKKMKIAAEREQGQKQMEVDSSKQKIKQKKNKKEESSSESNYSSNSSDSSSSSNDSSSDESDESSSESTD